MDDCVEQCFNPLNATVVSAYLHQGIERVKSLLCIVRA